MSTAPSCRGVANAGGVEGVRTLLVHLAVRMAQAGLDIVHRAGHLFRAGHGSLHHASHFPRLLGTRTRITGQGHAGDQQGQDGGQNGEKTEAAELHGAMLR